MAGMSKSRVDRDAVNADLRAKYGDSFTRTEMMEYKAAGNPFPDWIYRSKECKIGRGLFAIPGGTTSVKTESQPVVRARTMASTDRVSMPTAFDNPDEDYGTKRKTKGELRKEKAGKQGKKPAASMVTPGTDVDAPNVVPKFLTVYVCTLNAKHTARPLKVYEDNGCTAPTCLDCGSPMRRHSYVPVAYKRKF